EVGSEKPFQLRISLALRRFQLQPGGGQELIEAKVLAPTHITGKEVLHTAAGHRLTNLLKIRGRIITAFLKQPAVQGSKHIAQRLAVVGAPANLEVEQQAQQFALVVVRNLGIHRVFVRPIFLNPRVEARLFSAHLQPPGCLLKVLDGFRERVEIAAIRNQSGAPDHQIAVIAGNAFGDAERARVVLFGVIEWPEGVGANALYVPEMKELVRDQSIETLPAAFGAKVKAAEAERGGIQMLQSAARIRPQMQDEGVIVI